MDWSMMAFSPADHELITLFLRPKVAGLPFDGRFNIHQADAYSAAPADLVKNRAHAPGTDKHDGNGGIWYFFTTARHYQTKNRGSGGGRRQRAVGAVGDGCSWHSEGGEKPVMDAHGRRVGHLRKLSYGIRKSPGGFTRLGWCMTEFGLDDQDDSGWVLCKVYMSPHAAKASSMATAGSKRKVAEHPEAPRPQHASQELTDTDRRLHDIERLLLSDDNPMPAGVDGVQLGRPAEQEDDGRFEYTIDEFLGLSGSGDDEDRDVACPTPAPASICLV